MKISRGLLEKIEDSHDKGNLDQNGKRALAEEYGVPVSYVESLYTFYDGHETRDSVCTGLSCSMKRSGVNYASYMHENLEKESCLGFCDHAPVVRIGGKYYTDSPESLNEIRESTSMFITEKRSGIIEYRRRGGYSVLDTLLESGNTKSVFEMLERTGLKGMGGAGFPVIMKWKSFSSSRTENSVLLVNAHEGEPGTFKDRGILELEPHRVLDGALIAAISNHVTHIVIGLKKEYVNALESLSNALGELMAQYSDTVIPEIQIEAVGGTYVTGEETALMEAIEGRRSEPRLRPPFPTEKGLFGFPTLVHNVETLYEIADLMNSGRNEVKKRFCITGDIKAPGVYSAELGTTARHLIESVGRADPDSVKAFMPGGLSGGILPSEYMDIQLDFDAVRKAQAGLGTGAVIAVSEENCTVKVISNVMDFFSSESCGKCMPCRYGTAELSSIMHSVMDGKPEPGILEKGKETAQAMIDGSICALGQAAGKVFLDELRHFEGEVNEHLNGICSSGACRTGGH